MFVCYYDFMRRFPNAQMTVAGGWTESGKQKRRAMLKSMESYPGHWTVNDDYCGDGEVVSYVYYVPCI